MPNPKGHEDSIKDSRFKAAWQSGPTRTIRVPIALADATLEYARQLDQGTEPHDTSKLLDSETSTAAIEPRDTASIRAELEAELAELAQLKKWAKEHAAELHREQRSFELEKARWQQELSDARCELADAKATILKQADKIRELERGFSFKPNPAESRLRLEIGELNQQLADLKQNSASASQDVPEAADLLNQLKAKRKKSAVTLADVEFLLELLEG